ncbi:glycosyltransferase family 4 protein [Rubripirellula reticaptiva]|uniref:D-inositol 3-phosphate glycosyltransferase n=1 Tax=Rubripirellula reticaptiva TaxID=2528013 RepID=A0A5C6F7C6_9BACT|nr:glycosyltransferase family 4 protein [Rubripirellula reticaptiva]TWU55679.1 D-inositol 3-phosphate glycosyltransferase [Rubripirellula reticaptiva]
MKILYHHRTRGDGAEGVHINEMKNAFVELGHEVDLCCPKSAKREAGLKFGMTGTTAEKSKGLIGTIRIAVRQFAELGYNAISIPRLAISIFQNRPDVIYERYSCYHFAGVLVAKLARIPIVLEVNSTYAGRFNRRKIAFKNVCKLTERFVLSNSTLIATVSEPLRQCIVDRTNDSGRVVVTPNAINERRVRDHVQNLDASRQDLGIPSDSVVIGFVGSLRRWHGVGMLIRVMPEVLREIPNSIFLVVGAGELEGELDTLKCQQEVGNRLVLTGGVSHDRVNTLIDAMDIGLMPHSNDWGSPMKILEYMSLGKTCIAPRLPPIQEIVNDGETGVLFSAGSETEFLNAMICTCKDKLKRERIGANAKKYVLAERRWTDNASQIISVLDQYENSIKN